MINVNQRNAINIQTALCPTSHFQPGLGCGTAAAYDVDMAATEAKATQPAGPTSATDGSRDEPTHDLNM